MASSLAKFGPMLAVSALAGYCLAPLLSPPPISRDAPKAAAKLDPGLLDPPLEPPLQRDPFQADLPLPDGAVARTAAARGAASRVGPAAPGLPEGLVLGATLVHGRRHAAVINGKVYGEGDAVGAPDAPGGDAAADADAGAASAPRLVLKRIEHDRVWIKVGTGDADGDGEEDPPLALNYAPRKAPAAGGPGASPPATAAGLAAAAEPGGLEQIQALSQNPQFTALMTIAQGLFGPRLALPPSAAGLAPATPPPSTTVTAGAGPRRDRGRPPAGGPR
jgi:hypothetical protein